VVVIIVENFSSFSRCQVSSVCRPGQDQAQDRDGDESDSQCSCNPHNNRGCNSNVATQICKKLFFLGVNLEINPLGMNEQAYTWQQIIKT